MKGNGSFAFRLNGSIDAALCTQLIVFTRYAMREDSGRGGGGVQGSGSGGALGRCLLTRKKLNYSKLQLNKNECVCVCGGICNW